MLAVGDPRRSTIGRAVLLGLLSAAVFEVFAYLGKEIPQLYAHSPWADDPFDAFVSLAIFFVPLTAAIGVVRASLCRRNEPLPVTRITDLLRGTRLTVALVGVTVAADWISVGTGARAAAWSNVTALLVATLAVVTGLTVGTGWSLLTVADRSPNETSSAGPDGLADLVAFAYGVCERVGPLRRLRRLVDAADRLVVRPIRAHPLAWAAALSCLFGLAVAGVASVEEGVVPIAAIFFSVGAAGMFAFFAAGGTYLGVVRREQPLSGARRRVAVAAVVATATVPAALAFRDLLWWLIGSSPERAGVPQLAALLGWAAVAAFVLTLMASTIVERG